MVYCLNKSYLVRMTYGPLYYFSLHRVYLAGEVRIHFAFSLETTNTIMHVYLLSIETEIFGNTRSRNTTDVNKYWNIHNIRLMTITGLGIKYINIQYSLSSSQHFRIKFNKLFFLHSSITIYIITKSMRAL